MSVNSWRSMTRDARIGAVYKLARQNKGAVEIAKLLACKQQQINKLAQDEGIVIMKAVVIRRNAAPEVEDSIPLTLWERPEDERRRLVYEKQRRGARETRKANEEADRANA